MHQTSALQHRLFEFEREASLAPQEDWHEQMLTALAVDAGPAWPDRFGKALHQRLTTGAYSPVKTLSLFSGGGGLDIAFHDAGFEILEMVEIDPRFAATLSANTREGGMLGGGNVRCTDIREYKPPAHLAVDFIIGGPPCQTFSAAGRRASGVMGTNDPRGVLFEEYVRLLQSLRPLGFLFENVYGITGAENGDPWREIQEAFRAAGYVIHFRVLDAADYGVPQHRERLFIVGLRADTAAESGFRFPRPTHGPDAPQPRPFYTAREAIGGADPTEETSLLMRGRWGHLIAGIPPGLNYSYYTREMGHPNPVFSWRSKFSDFLYKADPEAPVRTVKAQGGAYTGPFSWENRHFSTAEIKRLQTFPDDYIMVGKRQTRLHQLGNSVPPQVGRILALSILHQVFGIALPFPMHYLSEHQPLGFRTRKRALTEQYAAKARAAIAVLLSDPQDEKPLRVSPVEEVRYLTDKFALADDATHGSFPLRLRYDYNGTTLVIRAEPFPVAITGNEGFSYTIAIAPAQNIDWHLPIDNAVLRGVGDEGFLFTALWKALEERIALLSGVDDLVQLSGYYQYSPKVEARMEVEGGSREADIPMVWRILCQVVGGAGVAVQLSEASFAERWQVAEADVLPALHALRTWGYEVRSRSTNPQITVGEYLIPYAFPTLTPRSVQRRKKL